jgi:hypothetical protein
VGIALAHFDVASEHEGKPFMLTVNQPTPPQSGRGMVVSPEEVGLGFNILITHKGRSIKPSPRINLIPSMTSVSMVEIIRFSARP